ncbi:putative cytosolic iron-sulfur protein assembly protein 1 [Mollisia scopiformis]|uniref:Probable cytosolic iron-sulfur protein assembly protein 1 n=1 Tax=Mollisia scopiformis TaxID=149040 RepID=A0A194WWX6_MOLSC|nr:putative cytosolic iron-sulfur protein assembly protein 1 [Mollisia scopiformis]KUJ12087.1 putative cytosolic iron-sulfur protein assembly protein 1 [Mollisia scopiformis]
MASLEVRIHAIAEFKPSAFPDRAWVSVPNPNNIPLIATATAEKSVRVYSLKNFTLHSKMEGGHNRSVRSVAWKPVTKNTGVLTVASGSFDSTMAIWRRREDGSSADLNGREEEEIFIENNVEEEEELEIEIGSDGKPKPRPRLITRTTDSDDENEDWAFEIVLEGHDSEIKDVAYSPSGQWLASCSRDKSIWIWEEIGEEGEDDFETIAVLQEHTADVKCVSWRKDDGNGEVVASGSYDDTIRFWKGDDEGEWSCISVLEGHEGTVWKLEWEPEVSMKRFSPEEEAKEDDHEPKIPRLLSASADCTIRVWSRAPTPPPPNKPSYFNSGIPSTMRPPPANETWECTATLPKVHDLPIYSVSWSPKTGRVVSAGGDSKIVIYEERTKGRTAVGGKIETEWVVMGVLESGHGPWEINHVVWCKRFDAGRKSEDEEMIISTGDDGAVRAWAIEEFVAPAENGVTVPVVAEGTPGTKVASSS